MTAARAVGRAEGLGQLGSFFEALLPEGIHDIWPVNLFDQITMLTAPPIKRRGSLCQAAVSVLLCDAVVQVSLTSREIMEIVDSSLPRLPSRLPRRIFLGKRGDRTPPFKSKPATQAERKVNLRFGDVWRDFTKEYPLLATAINYFSGLMEGLYDDQATAVLLTAAALYDVDNSVEIALRLVLYPAESKTLSSTLKSLGANGHHLGARLVEGDTLQGRLVGGVDLEEKVRERTDSPDGAGSLPSLDSGALRRSVRKVIEHELRGRKPVFQSNRDFWNARWKWCVNGGHSRAAERHDSQWRVETEGRVHRRVAMEEWCRNPLDHWDGEVYVSASAKLECGKTRLILACDTVSYVCFEHLLRPVEKSWRNDRVLLDPGSLGHSGTSDRVRGLGGDRGLWLMLDYDDFNSQHTLEAQAVVIEELCNITGYPEELGTRLVESFGKMHGCVGGKEVGVFQATLMSGHRGTTFLNGVLNAAYLDVATNGITWSIPALHTGDDVVMNAYDYITAGDILAGCKKSGLRMNPVKQSVGHVTAEFLRVAIKERLSRGYVLRAIASSIAGNWVTEEEEGPSGSARTYISNARTLVNRSGSTRMSRLLVTAFCRRTMCSVARARLLLSGEVALSGGPMFSRTRRYRSMEIVAQRRPLAERDKVLPAEATHAYLAYCVTPVELEALDLAEVSLEPEMIASSYAKTLSEGKSDTTADRIVFQPRVSLDAYGLQFDDEVVAEDDDEGLLVKYPLLHLLKNKLSSLAIRRLLWIEGWNGEGDVQTAAWGHRAAGAIIEGITSYSDASCLATMAKAGVVRIRRPCYV